MNRPARVLDAFDRAILRIVQADTKTPQRAIAAAVNLSPAAVQRRIAAMEAAGVIAANVALVDRRALGLTITSIVQVTLVDERPATVDRARAVFVAAAEVQQCYYVTGGISFVLVIVTRDMIAYEALTRRLFADNETVAGYHSYLALDRAKTGMAVPID